jgi:hypothetical protein
MGLPSNGTGFGVGHAFEDLERRSEIALLGAEICNFDAAKLTTKD